MLRRDLLGAAASALPWVVAGRIYAAPQAGSRFLLVFLRGGYDAANVIIPIGADFYYEARPTLQIARPDPANPAAAFPLDSDWGLHPALAATIGPLWSKNQLCFIPFAGTDDLSRSHFETQDTIELGQSLQGPRMYGSGFMSRLATVLNGARPIAFTGALPLIFRGGQPIPNMAMNSVSKPGVDDRQARLIQQMYSGGDLGASVSEGFRVRDQVYQSLSAEMVAAGRGAVTPQGFELAARRIGRLMREQFNLGFVDVGGWDTHVGQGAAKGYLADRLGELGRGLAAYVAELGPDAWNNTTVVVISEFGRTFRENGDRGTDHGHGSAYWVMGGGVRGGRIAGEQVKVSRETLNQDRDLPVLTDYRSLIGGLFARLYGLDGGRLQTVFPGGQPRDLGLV